MLNCPIHYRSNQALFVYQKPFIVGNVEVLVSLRQGLKPNPSHLRFPNTNVIKAFAMAASIHNPISGKVVVTIKPSINGLFPKFGFKRRLALEFLSIEMDPSRLLKFNYIALLYTFYHLFVLF